MTVTFHASLEGPSCIRYDGDGSCIVKLSVPASDLANVVKLLAYRETLLEVSVKPEAK
mgnify:CR=1 FL=1